MEWSPPYVPHGIRRAFILVTACWMLVLCGVAIYANSQIYWIIKEHTDLSADQLRLQTLLDYYVEAPNRKHRARRDNAVIALLLLLLWGVLVWLAAGFRLRRA